jgi:FSR family fosmidomycin resistance protein-like MFS transporter
VTRREWFGHLTRARLLRPALLGVPLLDELLCGFLVVSLPLVRDSLHLSYAQVGLLLTVGECTAMLIDPVVSLFSDRGSKRWPVLVGVLGTAAGFALAATAQSFTGMLVAFALLAPANAVGISLAQAALVDAAPEAAPRTVTRWTAMGAVGDLLSPLLFAAWTFRGLEWRPLFGLVAGVWLVVAVLLWPLRFPQAGVAAETPADQPAPGLFAGLKPALRSSRLLRWAAVLLVVDLLDEVWIGFAALFLTDVVRLTPTAASLALSAQMGGAILGLFMLDRLLSRFRGERLLPALACLTLVGTLLFLNVRTFGWASAALLLIGLGAAGWYPIAKAAAYATLPGRTGTVLAVLGITAPFEAALPAVVGAVASRWGIHASMGLLALAPLGVLLLAPRSRPPAPAQEAPHPNAEQTKQD